MTDFTIDTSELRRAAVDLAAAGTQVSKGLRPVVVKGAVNIKNQLRKEMQASRHFKGVSQGIDFDMKTTFGAEGSIEARIGPRAEPGSPGNLANIAYFGGSRGGGTVPDPRGALEAEVPRFERALTALLGRLL